MDNILDLKVGDHIVSRSYATELYEIAEWPDDPFQNAMVLRRIGEEEHGRLINYYKNRIIEKVWMKLSSAAERELRSAGAIMLLLGEEGREPINELLFRLEI